MKLFMIALLTLSMAVATVGPVHAQEGRRQAAGEGALAWARDGRCYMVRQGRWVGTAYTRAFPIQGNGRVFDVFENGRFVKRVDLSQSGWIYELDAAFQSSPYTWRRYAVQRPQDTVQYFAPSINRWQSVEVVLTNLIAQLNALVAQTRTQSVPQARVTANADAMQAQIMAITNATNYNMAKIWTAPNCTGSYNGC
jgi:hypothetical protein